MSDEQQIMDAEVVADEHRERTASTALERRSESSSASLFRTDDPVEVLEKATPVADALKRLVTDRGLIQNIRGKEHPKVEAWQTLGAMLGVTAVCVRTEPIQDRHGKPAYLATVEARFHGEVVGRADAMCSTSEGRWKTADDYAIRSMAQTRATSKALKGPLGWIMQLAGYETTPAEEMPVEQAAGSVGSSSRETAPPPAEPVAPEGQTETIDPATAVLLMDKAREKGLKRADVRALLALVYGDAAMRFDKDAIERAFAMLSPENAAKLDEELDS